MNGLKIRRLAYTAFGEEAENQGTGDDPKYTYTGKEHDATGLYYYGARYYDSALSRFITADTVYDRGPQGLNRYSYALNNPMRYHDPTGHYTKDQEKKMRDLGTFMDVFRQWEPVAETHRRTVGPIPIETKNHAKIRVFDADFAANPQIFVTEVGDDKQFSYNQSFGKYVDVGLPLDIQHFFRIAKHAENWPNFIVRKGYITRLGRLCEKS